jgi:hypothetical protein
LTAPAPPHANGHARPVTLVPLPVHASAPGWLRQDDPGRLRTLLDKTGHSAAATRHAVTAHRGWLAAVPIVLVNTVATGAQLGFWRAHLPAAQAVMVALALESIAIYLAWQAHLAQLADDSALRLRLAAYGFALVIGTLNYSHFMLPGWRPTVAAVTFGLMSAVSPWLWSVHSRRASRDALKARGLIEPHAVRLGATRWTWHPYRSACVMWRATWLGETDPAKAIALSAPATVVTPRHDSDHDKGDKQLPQWVRDKRAPALTQARPIDRARAAIRDNPDVTGNKALAVLAGCDVRTVQRARNGSRP